MRWSFFWKVLLGISLSCCLEESESIDSETITSEVHEMFDRYHSAIAKEGLRGEFDFLDTSQHFFWVPPGYDRALNYDTVRSILERNAVLFQEIEFHWDTLEIFPQAVNYASFTGVVGGHMVDTSGLKQPVRIIETGTVVKRPDGWKLLNGQSAALDGNNPNID